jgi:hypothetical protein
VKLTAQGLQQAAALEPDRFPVSEIRMPVIMSLIQTMKVAAAYTTPETLLKK